MENTWYDLAVEEVENQKQKIRQWNQLKINDFFEKVYGLELNVKENFFKSKDFILDWHWLLLEHFTFEHLDMRSLGNLWHVTNTWHLYCFEFWHEGDNRRQEINETWTQVMDQCQTEKVSSCSSISF